MPSRIFLDDDSSVVEAVTAMVHSEESKKHKKHKKEKKEKKSKDHKKSKKSKHLKEDYLDVPKPKKSKKEKCCISLEDPSPKPKSLSVGVPHSNTFSDSEESGEYKSDSEQKKKEKGKDHQFKDENFEVPQPKKPKKKRLLCDIPKQISMTNGFPTSSILIDSGDELSSTDYKTDCDQELTAEQKEGAFSNFNISKETINLLKARGVTFLFPVQVKTFNAVYSGKDVIAQARTGTGKTFSFAIPLIEKLQQSDLERKRGRAPKVLVLTPTRELAIQVSRDFKDVTKKLAVDCFYGGTAYRTQFDSIRNGIDILVGTPGRIKDQLQNHNLNLSHLKHVVLDEVDQMLDMGFAEQVEEILSVAYKKDSEDNPQTLLFSATCPQWVYEVARKYMKSKYEEVDLVGKSTQRAATSVEHLAIACHWSQRAAVIGDVIQVYSGSHGRTIVFCETKKEVSELTMNTSIKQDVDSYIHRSGRTGRAGREGVCICFYQRKEESQLRYVEQKAGLTFKRVGVPSATDIIKASSKDAIRNLDSVPPSAIEHFKKSAEQLIEQKGAVEALAAALAHISGATAIEQRSLLNSDAGFVTVILQCSTEMHNMSYAWRELKEQLGNEIDDKVNRMCFLKGKLGVCFDVPAADLKAIQESWKDTRRWQLTVATDLPELEERERRFSDFSGRRQGGGFHGKNQFRNKNRGQKRSFESAFR
ncbi:nucleolar RNA helicase 2 isoform X2 [Ambystoma mexicanum]|uniref:nucleolar RNA helicase 2 isoform X2 n=1 Tax=Ambystoma mexicanum TaxID=8296 RepID=UPI0037E9959A